MDIPNDIANILGILSNTESIFLENPRTYQRGEDMIDSLRNSYQGQRINVIPDGMSGECQQVLLVAIGKRKDEDVEKRILQAIEHINVRCLGITKYVIFWAAKWESMAWMKHRDSFKNAIVILKLFGIDPVILRGR